MIQIQNQGVYDAILNQLCEQYVLENIAKIEYDSLLEFVVNYLTPADRNWAIFTEALKSKQSEPHKDFKTSFDKN